MRRLILVCVMALAAMPAAGVVNGLQSFAGRVLSVTDGDTLVVARGRGQVTVRLYGVDAPEGSQAYGAEATRALRALVLDRVVTITMRDVDAYGRTVGEVTVGGVNVGESLVRAGAAWHFTRYSNSAALARAEREARAARRGLWAQPGAVPPWEFRERAAAAASSSGAVKAAGPFRGNRESKVLHAPGCEHYTCANCTVIFQTVEQARAQGFRPHTTCVR